MKKLSFIFISFLILLGLALTTKKIVCNKNTFISNTYFEYNMGTSISDEYIEKSKSVQHDETTRYIITDKNLIKELAQKEYLQNADSIIKIIDDYYVDSNLLSDNNFLSNYFNHTKYKIDNLKDLGSGWKNSNQFNSSIYKGGNAISNKVLSRKDKIIFNMDCEKKFNPFRKKLDDITIKTQYSLEVPNDTDTELRTYTNFSYKTFDIANNNSNILSKVELYKPTGLIFRQIYRQTK